MRVSGIRVLVLSLWLVALQPPAHAADCPDATRVLGPEASGVVRRALGALHPQQLQVRCDTIAIQLCPDARTCTDIDLSDAQRGCASVTAGAWCISTPPGRQALVETLANHLRDVPGPWRGALVSADLGEPATASGDPGAAYPWWAWLLAVALLAAPFALGRALGAWARSRHQTKRRFQIIRWATAAVVLGGTLPLTAWLPGVGFWDLLLLAGLATAGWLTATAERRMEGPARRVAVIASLLSLGAAELAVRALLPQPHEEPVRDALTFAPEAREPGCQLLYPELAGDRVGALDAAASTASRRVLHVGDSMLLDGAEPAERAISRINASDPDSAHLNAAMQGTGTDFQSVVFERWAARTTPALAMVWLYPGNDMADVDKAYACCAAGPLLDDSEPPNARCAAPEWSFDLGTLVARSPPPYPVRVAATVSALAAHLSAAMRKAVAPLEPATGANAGFEGDERSLTREASFLRRIKATSEALRVPVVAVILPFRGRLHHLLEDGPAASDVGTALVRAATDAGLEVWDARPTITAAARDHGVAALYSPEGGWNEHFGPLGHRVLASWAEPRIADRLAAARREP